MQIDLSGKRALVTGGATGIGRGAALALAEAGADVAITYHSHDGDAVADEIRALGRRSDAIALDATNSAEVDQAVEQTASALGGIDILVNNAGGLIARKSVAEMEDAHWSRVIDLNLSSVLYFIRATLRHMPDGGRIVSVSSLAGQNGGGNGASAYAAAKAGIHGLTYSLAKELGPRGITVNAIAPGLILDTPFHETFTPKTAQQAAIDATPLKRAGYPADIAGAVLYLASDLGSFATGTVIGLNGGTYFA